MSVLAGLAIVARVPVAAELLLELVVDLAPLLVLEHREVPAEVAEDAEEVEVVVAAEVVVEVEEVVDVAVVSAFNLNPIQELDSESDKWLT